MNIRFFTLMAMWFSISFLLGYSDYDTGYEAAWEEDEPAWYASQDEKDGYEDGLDDLWMYDEGYYAGINKKKPEYWDDEFYKDGYKDGKADR